MRQHVLRGAIGLLLIAVASAQNWQSGPMTGFRFWRFDGEYFPGTGMVYFLGGRLTDGNTDGSVWRFDPLTQTYADMGVDLQTPISNYDICVVRDDRNLPEGDTYGLYIVGGRTQSGTNTDAVQVYYPVSNTVATITTDPFPGRLAGNIYSAMSCTVLDNKIWVMGGLYATSFLVSNLAYVFDPLAPAGSRWTALPNINHSRAYIMGAAIDTLLFAVGGDTAIPSSSSLEARTSCEVLNTRNPGAGWTNVASLPQANGETRAFAFGFDSPYEFVGKIIIAGMGQWPYEYANCFIYDVASNSWTTFPNLIGARRNMAGALIPGTGANGVPGIWVWGGRASNDTNVLRTSEYYQLSLTGIAEQSRFEPVQLVVTPQPVTAQSQVRFSLPRSSAVRLGLYGLSGQLVRILGQGRLPAGHHVISVEPGKLPRGIYLLTLETNAGRSTRKVIVE